MSFLLETPTTTFLLSHLTFLHFTQDIWLDIQTSYLSIAFQTPASSDQLLEIYKELFLLHLNKQSFQFQYQTNANQNNYENYILSELLKHLSDPLNVVALTTDERHSTFPWILSEASHPMNRLSYLIESLISWSPALV